MLFTQLFVFWTYNLKKLECLLFFFFFAHENIKQTTLKLGLLQKNSKISLSALTAQMAKKSKSVFNDYPILCGGNRVSGNRVSGNCISGNTCIALRNSFYLNDLLCFSFGLPKAMPKSEIEQ